MKKHLLIAIMALMGIYASAEEYKICEAHCYDSQKGWVIPYVDGKNDISLAPFTVMYASIDENYMATIYLPGYGRRTVKAENGGITVLYIKGFEIRFYIGRDGNGNKFIKNAIQIKTSVNGETWNFFHSCDAYSYYS